MTATSSTQTDNINVHNGKSPADSDCRTYVQIDWNIRRNVIRKINGAMTYIGK